MNSVQTCLLAVPLNDLLPGFFLNISVATIAQTSLSAILSSKRPKAASPDRRSAVIEGLPGTSHTGSVSVWRK